MDRLIVLCVGLACFLIVCCGNVSAADAPPNKRPYKEKGADVKTYTAGVDEVLKKNNSKARRNPSDDKMVNAITEYEYTDGELYQVYTAPLFVTDIILQIGEVMTASPKIGDAVRWILTTATSGSGSGKKTHIQIKPKKGGLNTTLSVYTNRRAYRLELHSSEGNAYMAELKWVYGDEERDQQPIYNNSSTEVDPKSLNHGYTIEPVGEAPHWLPVAAFDDGQKYYIQFPATIKARDELPALFVARDGKTEIVNSRFDHGFYIADHLIDHAVLKYGSDQVDIYSSRTNIKKQKAVSFGNGSESSDVKYGISMGMGLMTIDDPDRSTDDAFAPQLTVAANVPFKMGSLLLALSYSQFDLPYSPINLGQKVSNYQIGALFQKSVLIPGVWVGLGAGFNQYNATERYLVDGVGFVVKRFKDNSDNNLNVLVNAGYKYHQHRFDVKFDFPYSEGIKGVSLRYFYFFD